MYKAVEVPMVAFSNLEAVNKQAVFEKGTYRFKSSTIIQRTYVNITDNPIYVIEGNGVVTETKPFNVEDLRNASYIKRLLDLGIIRLNPELRRPNPNDRNSYVLTDRYVSKKFVVSIVGIKGDIAHHCVHPELTDPFFGKISNEIDNILTTQMSLSMEGKNVIHDDDSVNAENLCFKYDICTDTIKDQGGILFDINTSSTFALHTVPPEKRINGAINVSNYKRLSGNTTYGELHIERSCSPATKGDLFFDTGSAIIPSKSTECLRHANDVINVHVTNIDGSMTCVASESTVSVVKNGYLDYKCPTLDSQVRLYVSTSIMTILEERAIREKESVKGYEGKIDKLTDENEKIKCEKAKLEECLKEQAKKNEEAMERLKNKHADDMKAKEADCKSRLDDAKHKSRNGIFSRFMSAIGNLITSLGALKSYLLF